MCNRVQCTVKMLQNNVASVELQPLIGTRTTGVLLEKEKTNLLA